MERVAVLRGEHLLVRVAGGRRLFGGLHPPQLEEELKHLAGLVGVHGAKELELRLADVPLRPEHAPGLAAADLLGEGGDAEEEASPLAAVHVLRDVQLAAQPHLLGPQCVPGGGTAGEARVDERLPLALPAGPRVHDVLEPPREEVRVGRPCL